MREEVLSGFIRLVTHTAELQSYTVFKLYTALRADVSQESLTLAGVWTIGEFGDVLLQGGTVTGSGEDEESTTTTSDAVVEKDVVDLMETILISPYTNNNIRGFVLTASTKLSSRFNDPTQLTRLRNILHGFDTSIELELQQRAIEFGRLMELEGINKGVLERMPPPELKPTVMGTVSEKRAVGSTRADKDVSGVPFVLCIVRGLTRFVVPPRSHGRRVERSVFSRDRQATTDDTRPPGRHLWHEQRRIRRRESLIRSCQIVRQRHPRPVQLYDPLSPAYRIAIRVSFCPISVVHRCNRRLVLVRLFDAGSSTSTTSTHGARGVQLERTPDHPHPRPRRGQSLARQHHG